MSVCVCCGVPTTTLLRPNCKTNIAAGQLKMGQREGGGERARQMSNKLANNSVYPIDLTADSLWLCVSVCTYNIQRWGSFQTFCICCRWVNQIDVLQFVHVQPICGWLGVAYQPQRVYTSKFMFSFVVMRQLLLPPPAALQQWRHSGTRNLQAWWIFWDSESLCFNVDYWFDPTSNQICF